MYLVAKDQLQDTTRKGQNTNRESRVMNYDNDRRF